MESYPDRSIHKLAPGESPAREQIARLKAVKGIGLLSCYALLVAYHSGRFVHHDAFVAYLGLDVRARKLARLAFQLLSKNLAFDPTRLGASQRT